MLKLVSILCGCLWLLPANAQVGTRSAFPSDFHGGIGAGVHSSLSGQFVIHEPANPGGYPIPLGTNSAIHYVRINPTLLAVSCERIKQAFLAELGATDKWQDKIFMDLQRARTLNDTIIIAASPYGRNWSYHVSVPDALDSSRLVTTVVDVLLLEMANRRAERSAEIPAWLGYGLGEDIMRSSHAELVLEPAKPVSLGLNINLFSIIGTNTNSLALAHEDCGTTPPLTLEQLSWPDETQLEGKAGETYRSSAQLFVRELLQLKDGRACLRAFVQELPQHLNWQLSFLHAFRTHFANQLELEKWWTLRLVDFTGRDISQTWNVDESWQKLDHIIHPVVEVRTRMDELPLRTEVPLQTIIQQWDVFRQMGLLKERSDQLYQLRSKVSQDLAKLTDDYRRTIDYYLAKRTREGFLRSGHSQAVLGLDKVAQRAISELDMLDGIRDDLRPKPRTLQSADASQRVNR